MASSTPRSSQDAQSASLIGMRRCRVLLTPCRFNFNENQEIVSVDAIDMREEELSMVSEVTNDIIVIDDSYEEVEPTSNNTRENDVVHNVIVIDDSDEDTGNEPSSSASMGETVNSELLIDLEELCSEPRSDSDHDSDSDEVLLNRPLNTEGVDPDALELLELLDKKLKEDMKDREPKRAK